MRQSFKRFWLVMLGGILIQIVIFLVTAVLISPMLSIIFLLPGWALVFAGRSSDPPFGWAAMLLINEIIYAPLTYLLLYWKPFRKPKILSIRASDD